MTLPRWITPGALAFLAIWLVLMAGGSAGMLRDPGTFWHTMTGEAILERGEVIDTDPFSFTYGGTHWIPYQWLGEVWMALLNRLGGLDAELVFTTAVLAAVFAWLGSRFLNSGWHWLPCALVVCFGMAAAATHFHVRPHVATIAFMAVFAALLTDFEAGKVGVARLLWLVPVTVVWSNIHGGVLGGIATCVIALMGWSAWRLIGWPSPVASWATFGRIVGVGLLLGLATLVNPFGWGMVSVWLDIMGSSTLPKIIVEHAPIAVGDPASWAYLAFGAFYVVMLLGVRERPRVMWLVPLAWLALGCERVRHMPLFSVTALVALADFFPRTVYARKMRESGSDLFVASTQSKPWTFSVLVVPSIAVLIALFTVRGWARLDPKYWPTRMGEELAAHSRDGAKIFNEVRYGGYLIYHHPAYRVFVDDRCELYRYDWLADVVRASQTGTAEAVAAWQAKYGAFDFALIETGGQFDQYFAAAPGWKLIRKTPTATFYERGE